MKQAKQHRCQTCPTGLWATITIRSGLRRCFACWLAKRTQKINPLTRF